MKPVDIKSKTYINSSKLFVKWKGYCNVFDSWIDKKGIA